MSNGAQADSDFPRLKDRGKRSSDMAPAGALNVLPRREPLHPAISEDMIEALVRDFYGRVRDDSLLGPIFARAITDWEPHLKTMMNFWSSVTLMTGRFHGQPVQKHSAIPDLGPEHFSRWLMLFRECAWDVLSPDLAAIFIDRAERIGESLLRGVVRVQNQQPVP